MKKPKWKLHEDTIAKDLNGKKNKGSGNSWAHPGDIKTSEFLIEAKRTEKKSYSITLETWNKIEEEALFSFRIPILALNIQDTELIALSKEDFLNLIKNN